MVEVGIRGMQRNLGCDGCVAGRGRGRNRARQAGRQGVESPMPATWFCREDEILPSRIRSGRRSPLPREGRQAHARERDNILSH